MIRKLLTESDLTFEKTSRAVTEIEIAKNQSHLIKSKLNENQILTIHSVKKSYVNKWTVAAIEKHQTTSREVKKRQWQAKVLANQEIKVGMQFRTICLVRLAVEDVEERHIAI